MGHSIGQNVCLVLEIFPTTQKKKMQITTANLTANQRITIQPLHLRLKEHHERRDRQIVRARGP